jgi:Spy/CpxP family protein refolding chaperone
MKGYVWAFVLALSTAPVFSQDPEEFETRIGAVFAEGNLALRELESENHPVAQLRRFFNQARLPLTSAQQRQLNSIIDAQAKAVKASPPNRDAIRVINEEYTAKFYGVLTPDQRLTLRRYRTDQIMLHGGYAQLKMILDNAKKPLTPEQERQARALYDELNQEVKQIPRDSKGAPDRMQLDKAENSALTKVVQLLTPEQRQVLVDSRQSSVNRLPR